MKAMAIAGRFLVVACGFAALFAVHHWEAVPLFQRFQPFDAVTEILTWALSIPILSLNLVLLAGVYLLLAWIAGAAD
jgi:hypothetical protein